MRQARWQFVGSMAMTCAVVAWGCDGGKPSVESSSTEATVKGKVILKGKPVTKGGEVSFDPANYQRKDVAVRTAPINPDGTYTITTLVGVNTIRVKGPEASKAVGLDYANMTFDVQSGENTYDIVHPPAAAPPPAP